MAGTLVTILSIAALFVIGTNAGAIPACQQQLTSILSARLNLSLLNSACIREAFPELSSLNVSLLTPNVTCIDDIHHLKTIVDVIVHGLARNISICGIRLDPLNLASADVRLDILGIVNLAVSVLNVQVFGLSNVTADVSLVTQSPKTLTVELDVPLRIKTGVKATVGLGLPVLSTPINVDVPIDIKARLAVSLLVSIAHNGVLNVQISGFPGCSVDDFDFSSAGLLSLLNISTVSSIVSTVVTGLVNTIGALLSNLLVLILKLCIQIVLNVNI